MNAFRRPALFALAALVGGLAAPVAAAHPHMFFDARAELLTNGAGDLSGLRVAFIVDEFNTLYTIGELGVDQDGDGELTTEDQEVVANGLTIGLGAYEFFTDLKVNGARVALPDPSGVAVLLQSGRLAMRLDFALPTPTPLAGATIDLALYDRTYFTEVRTNAAPTLAETPAACEVMFEPFVATEALAETQLMLSRLARDDFPENRDVGKLFADHTTVKCAS